jgi:hypothetical protein
MYGKHRPPAVYPGENPKTKKTMKYVNTVIKDFADFMELPIVEKPVKKVKIIKPDADTIAFQKFLEKEERNFDRMLNRIVGKLEREING